MSLFKNKSKWWAEIQPLISITRRGINIQQGTISNLHTYMNMHCIRMDNGPLHPARRKEYFL